MGVDGMLDSVTIAAGQNRSAPDLSLVEGGWIEGRLPGQLTSSRTVASM